MSERRASIRRIVILSVAAFFVYGAWAAFANREHGTAVVVRTFFVQGSSSAISTATVSSAIEVLWRWFGGARWAVFAAALSASLVAACLHSTLHALARTPNLLAAVALPTCMGLVFGLAYALTLSRRMRARADAEGRVASKSSTLG